MFLFIILIFLIFLIGSIIYRKLNHRQSLWEGFLDFLFEMLYSSGLWHPYLSPDFLLSYEQALDLVTEFDSILIHPVLLDFELNEPRGWLRIQLGFLDWKSPFTELPLKEKLEKMKNLVIFYYRTKRGTRLTKDCIFFIGIDRSNFEFKIPLNDAGRQELSSQSTHRFFS